MKEIQKHSAKHKAYKSSLSPMITKPNPHHHRTLHPFQGLTPTKPLTSGSMRPTRPRTANVHSQNKSFVNQSHDPPNMSPYINHTFLSHYSNPHNIATVNTQPRVSTADTHNFSFVTPTKKAGFRQFANLKEEVFVNQMNRVHDKKGSSHNVISAKKGGSSQKPPVHHKYFVISKTGNKYQTLYSTPQ